MPLKLKLILRTLWVAEERFKLFTRLVGRLHDRDPHQLHRQHHPCSRAQRGVLGSPCYWDYHQWLLDHGQQHLQTNSKRKQFALWDEVNKQIYFPNNKVKLDPDSDRAE